MPTWRQHGGQDDHHHRDRLHAPAAAEATEESFSDLVVRHTEGRKNVLHLAGSWKSLPRKDYEEMAKALEEAEANSERKMHRRMVAMRKRDEP